MHRPQVTHELKNDLMGLVERLDGPLGPVVRRVACGRRLPGTGILARILMRRERRALHRLEEVPGVAGLIEDEDYRRTPSLDGTVPAARDVLMRSWVEGRALQEAMALPRDFFDRLEELVRELHARRVCHNDLHKEANILAGEDGYPALVDFQLASVHVRDDRTFQIRSREDLRHVEKHRHKYLQRGSTVSKERGYEEKRRSTLAALWLRFGKPPYLLVTRRLFRYQGGERGRPKTGPWPEWVPPVGPRS